MNRKLLMVAISILLITAIIIPVTTNAQSSQPIIIDHNCTDLSKIPNSAITQAKNSLHIAYEHTSHGSQLISGMGSSGTSNGLDTFLTENPNYPDYTAGLCRWMDDGGAAGLTSGYLDLDNDFASGDLGNPNRTAWASETRDYLGAPITDTADPNYGRGSIRPEINVIIWSWCGQASTSIENIDIYLNLMEGLIKDYPNVHFVFMTGHLNGTGATGLLNLANEHIRNHCRNNNRILYDFADIESYDPIWDTSYSNYGTNYMELNAYDTCAYDGGNNWALDWQAAHTEGVDWWASGAAHSQHLNGNLKGYAAWWLWARLGGWDGNLGTDPVPEIPTIIMLTTGLLALGGFVWLRRRSRRSSITH